MEKFKPITLDELFYNSVADFEGKKEAETFKHYNTAAQEQLSQEQYNSTIELVCAYGMECKHSGFVQGFKTAISLLIGGETNDNTD